MAEPKTKENDGDVVAFIDRVPDEAKRADAHALLKLMKAVTRKPARMWGDSIVGFGSYHYKYASGREGDWMLTGFSPRKQNISIYVMSGFDLHAEEMKKLGKYKLGVCCLYVKRLEDIDLKVLREILRVSVKHVAKHHGCGGKG